MDHSELIRLVRIEVSKQMNVILQSLSGATTTHSEVVDQLFPGMSPSDPRPIMQPFGVSSRAPVGTINVVARQGEHAGNRIILGHRDRDKPDVLEGEAALYNSHGQQIYLKNGQIHIGTPTAANPVVLGDVLKTCLSTVFDAIAKHKHIDSIGGITQAPITASTFSGQKSSPVDDGAMLSDHIFVTKAPGGGT